jgi:hypothetical protein
MFLLIIERETNLWKFGAVFVGLAYKGKGIVFRFIIEYSSLRDFGPQVIIGLFWYEGVLKDDILGCVETWE